MAVHVHVDRLRSWRWLAMFSASPSRRYYFLFALIRHGRHSSWLAKKKRFSDDNDEFRFPFVLGEKSTCKTSYDTMGMGYQRRKTSFSALGDLIWKPCFPPMYIHKPHQLSAYVGGASVNNLKNLVWCPKRGASHTAARFACEVLSQAGAAFTQHSLTTTADPIPSNSPSTSAATGGSNRNASRMTP